MNPWKKHNIDQDAAQGAEGLTLAVEQALEREAQQLGFSLFGIAGATEADGFQAFVDWVDAGYAGEMNYLEDVQKRQHPRSILPEVRSVIMLGLEYGSRKRSLAGQIASYALAPDYHQVIWRLLGQLGEAASRLIPGVRHRGVTDSAPLLERDFARRAGLGWFGKNTMLIHKKRGSFLFLAALLLDHELQPHKAEESTHCGTCTACLEVCPTDAFVAPYQLDARRCISYLTIEHRSTIPKELRPALADMLFGCDLCQDVCPWNRKPMRQTLPSTSSLPLLESLMNLDLRAMLQWDEKRFKQELKGTSLMRTKYLGMMRNALIVLGNTGTAADLSLLQDVLERWVENPILHETAHWAIEQIKNRSADQKAP